MFTGDQAQIAGELLAAGKARPPSFAQASEGKEVALHPSRAIPAPPPAPVRAANTAPPAPAAPAPPPPLVVPATFFGYVADVQTGTRRALFSEGDDVYVLGVGDILAGRFRQLQIGNSTAELEETSTGRRTTLTMEEPTGS